MPQLARVPLAMKQDEPPDPVDVRLLRSDTIVLDAQSVAELVQQSGLALWGASGQRFERHGFYLLVFPRRDSTAYVPTCIFIHLSRVIASTAEVQGAPHRRCCLPHLGDPKLRACKVLTSCSAFRFLEEPERRSRN